MPQITVIDESTPHFCPFLGRVENEHSGSTGEGYVNSDNKIGTTLTWAIEVQAPGSYAFEFRYANGNPTNRPGELSIDGQSKTLTFPTTNGWDVWATQSQTFDLTSGSHLLKLKAIEDAGLANIDVLHVTGGATVNPAMCPAQAPLTVWLAGDSTVANGQTPCPVGWGKTFDALFNDNVNVQNYAAGGRSVRTWLYDVTDTMGNDGECVVNTQGNGNPILQDRWVQMMAQMSEGDYLFIQFGINDGARTCPRHVGTNALKNEYIYMAQTAMSKGVHPILVTPSPAIACSGSTAVANRGFVNEVKAVANQLNIPVIDLHQLGINLYNQLAFCPVPGGDVSASTQGPVGQFFCDDHTHFDTPGAQQISQLIAEALQSQFIPLANYLKSQTP